MRTVGRKAAPVASPWGAMSSACTGALAGRAQVREVAAWSACWRRSPGRSLVIVRRLRPVRPRPRARGPRWSGDVDAGELVLRADGVAAAGFAVLDDMVDEDDGGAAAGAAAREALSHLPTSPVVLEPEAMDGERFGGAIDDGERAEPVELLVECGAGAVVEGLVGPDVPEAVEVMSPGTPRATSRATMLVGASSKWRSRTRRPRRGVGARRGVEQPCRLGIPGNEVPLAAVERGRP